MIKLIISILIGAAVGYVAGEFMGKGNRGFIVNTLLGIVGGAVGGIIGKFLPFSGGFIVGFILSVIGACLVIWLVDKLKK